MFKFIFAIFVSHLYYSNDPLFYDICQTFNWYPIPLDDWVYGFTFLDPNNYSDILKFNFSKDDFLCGKLFIYFNNGYHVNICGHRSDLNFSVHSCCDFDHYKILRDKCRIMNYHYYHSISKFLFLILNYFIYF